MASQDYLRAKGEKMDSFLSLPAFARSQLLWEICIFLLFLETTSLLWLMSKHAWLYVGCVYMTFCRLTYHTLSFPPLLNTGHLVAQHLAQSLDGDRIYISLNFMLLCPIKFLFISKDGQTKLMSFCIGVW